LTTKQFEANFDGDMDKIVYIDKGKTKHSGLTAPKKKSDFDILKNKSDKNLSIYNDIDYEHLAALFETSQTFNSTLNLENVVEIVMDAAIKMFKAERGLLMLLDNKGKLLPKAAYNIKTDQIDSDHGEIAALITQITVQSGQIEYIPDIRKDERFSGDISPADLNIISIMCMPLKIKENTIGVLYIDSSAESGILPESNMAITEKFAAQAASAIHNAALYTEELEFRRLQQNIISNTSIGILVVDADSEIIEVNEAVIRIFSKVGWANNFSVKDSMIGTKLIDVIPEKYYKTFIDSIQKAELEPLELSRLNIDSKNCECVLTLKFCPFCRRNEKSAGHVIFIENITEQVIIEQYLILSEKLIAKGEMAAAIGHELNNYLTVISTNAQLLSMNRSQGKTDKLEDKINIIIENVAFIKKFSDGLMDFSALESEFVSYDLRRLIEDLVFFIQPQKMFKGVTFNIDIPSRLPNVYIDAGQIHQALLNIFINAADEFAKSMEGQGIISIKVTPQDKDNTVKIIIADNGPGIKDDIFPRIFEPHVSSKKTGHGFGLWTSHRIVKNHGGKITACNLKGKGAAFEIVLSQSANK